MPARRYAIAQWDVFCAGGGGRAAGGAENGGSVN
jgi:hypothetical protein